MSAEIEVNFRLNGKATRVRVPALMNTLTMLRDKLHLAGTKLGCGEGECGACTILVDGMSVNSCLMFAVDCDGRELLTIEGLRTKEGLDIVQESFIKHGAVQCGFCTPGLVLQGKHITNQNPDASVEEIKRGIEGNLCRCTGYKKVIEAIAYAVRESGTASRQP